MNKYDKTQDKIIEFLYELEDMINIQKCWIEISNAIMDDPVDYVIHLSLVLKEIEKQNTKMYELYESGLANLSRLFSS